MPYWILTILLLILATTLAVLEVFFPLAGVLAFLCGGPDIGHCNGFLSGILVRGRGGADSSGNADRRGCVGAEVLAKTAMGKRILLTAPDSDAVLPDEPDRDFLRGLVGRTVGRRANCC